jgi:hypothetical protein
MAISAADVAKLQAAMAAEPEDASLSALATLEEIIGFVVAIARAGGHDEADAVEVVCRAAGVERERLLEIAHVLKPLGYKVACARLRKVARRAPPRPTTFLTRWGRKIEEARAAEAVIVPTS